MTFVIGEIWTPKEIYWTKTTIYINVSNDENAVLRTDNDFV